MEQAQIDLDGLLCRFGNADYSPEFFKRIHVNGKNDMDVYEEYEREQKRLVARKLGNIA